jgi:hypothetical protein
VTANLDATATAAQAHVNESKVRAFCARDRLSFFRVECDADDPMSRIFYELL